MPPVPVNVDFYAILEVSVDATEVEVKKAFKVAALRWHPDKNPGKETEAAEKFKQIAEAYTILGDKDLRSQYDSARKASKVEVEVIIISDDDEKQPAGPKKKRRKKPSYFNKFTTFEQAKRFFEEFMENEDEWDPEPEQAFHANPQDPELSPPVFARSDEEAGSSDDSDGPPRPPRRARLNPTFRARIDAQLGAKRK